MVYRSDEDRGISGAIGTLAGLIPSPVYQRNRAILRFKYWMSGNLPDDFEMDDLSDSEPAADSTTTKNPTETDKSWFNNFGVKSEKKLLGISIPILGRKKANSDLIKSKTLTDGVDHEKDSKSLENRSDSMVLEDQSSCVVNGGLISSIYADRMSIVTKLDDQNLNDAMDDWSGRFFRFLAFMSLFLCMMDKLLLV